MNFQNLSTIGLSTIALNYSDYIYEKIRNNLSSIKIIFPVVDKIDCVVPDLKKYFNLECYTLIIDKENIIFNKLLGYVLFKYEINISQASLKDGEHMKLQFNNNKLKFKKYICDHYNSQKILIHMEENQIVLKSSLDIIKLKEYVKDIISQKIGTRKLIIHHPIIEYTTSNGKSTKKIFWKSYNMITNKTYKNTIVTDQVEELFIKDLQWFVENEFYFNNKGIPYKRGYLLHGPPGTGKTSMIKAVANHYGMDVYIINMADIEEPSDITRIFEKTKTAENYHLLCLEDLDKCPIFNYSNAKRDACIGTLLNELDGLMETSKRVTIVTANDIKMFDKFKALMRPGRIDVKIKLDYCTEKQVIKLYNHFSDCEDILESVKINNNKLTPAQIVKYILNDTQVKPKQFQDDLGEIHKIQVSEESFLLKRRISFNRRRRKETAVQRKKWFIKRLERDIQKSIRIVEKHNLQNVKHQTKIAQEKIILKTLIEKEKVKKEKDRIKKNKIKPKPTLKRKRSIKKNKI